LFFLEHKNTHKNRFKRCAWRGFARNQGRQKSKLRDKKKRICLNRSKK